MSLNPRILVQGREDFIKRYHMPVKAGLTLHQVDLVSRIGNLSGSLNPGDASSDNQSIKINRNLLNLQGLMIEDTPHCCVH